jgi:hypothetical protein
MKMMFVPYRKLSYGPPRPVTWIALPFLHVDVVRVSQEPIVWAPTACYGNSFTFLHAGDVGASEASHL